MSHRVWSAVFPMFIILVSATHADLIHHYTLDGHSNDVLGEQNGTMRNTVPTTDRHGTDSGALHFNGTDAYVDMPSFDSVLNYDKDWSLNVWANTTRGAREGMLFGGADGGSRTKQFSFSPISNRVTNHADMGADYHIVDGNRYHNKPNGDGAWHMYTLTWDNAGVFSFFIDGILFGTDTTGAQAVFYPDSWLPVLGANREGFNRTIRSHFNGALDDFRIYNHTLSQKEITNLALSGGSKTLKQGNNDKQAFPLIRERGQTSPFTKPDDAQSSDDSTTLSVHLTPTRRGIMGSLVGYYRPMRITLLDRPSEVLRKEPGYSSEAPLYGAMQLGDGQDCVVTVVVDEPEDGRARIYIDRNNDEDLTNDGAGSWTSESSSHLKLSYASIIVDYATGPMHYTFSFYRLKTRSRDVVFYYRNSARQGELVSNGQTYKVAVLDENADGCFDDLYNGTLLIDLNQDGILVGSTDSAERHELDKPFNMHGKTWQVERLSADGSKLTLRSSMAGANMQAYLEPGYPAPSFSGQDLEGHAIELIREAKSAKYILLDFWASWCGPCRRKFPYLRRLHAGYRYRGLRILGINQDSRREAAQKAVEENGLGYPHVLDGLDLKNTVAVQYRVHEIPQTYLLDGDLNIVAKNMGGASLERKIAELLGPADEKAIEIMEVHRVESISTHTEVTQRQPVKVSDPSAIAIPKEKLVIPSAMQACGENLKEIYEAIKKHEKAHGQLPDWLSDLVPTYLKQETLFCPHDKEHTAPSYSSDPKMPCSYGWQFSGKPIQQKWDPTGKTLFRDWKREQVKVFGDIVPMVRCYHHDQYGILNLSAGGDLWWGALVWEPEIMPNYDSIHQQTLTRAVNARSVSPSTGTSLPAQQSDRSNLIEVPSIPAEKRAAVWAAFDRIDPSTIMNATHTMHKDGSDSKFKVMLDYTTELSPWGLERNRQADLMELSPNTPPHEWILPSQPDSSLRRYWGRKTFGHNTLMNVVAYTPQDPNMSTWQVFVVFDKNADFKSIIPISIAKGERKRIEFDIAYSDGTVNPYVIDIGQVANIPGRYYLMCARRCIRAGILELPDGHHRIAISDEDVDGVYSDLKNTTIAIDSEKLSGMSPFKLGDSHYFSAEISDDGSWIAFQPAKYDLLEGQVTCSSTKVPVGGATIKLMPHGFSTQTDERGRYRLRLPVGRYYSAQITAPGFILARVSRSKIPVVSSEYPAKFDATLDPAVIPEPGELTLSKSESYHFLSGQLYPRPMEGDFSFGVRRGEPTFWANNTYQGGLIDLGVLDNSLESIDIPESGYTRTSLKAYVGHVYVSRAKDGETDCYIVFRVKEITKDERCVLEYVYRQRGPGSIQASPTAQTQARQPRVEAIPGLSSN
jgi:thiol-disulfide isomerase/thioredoxin